MDTFPESLSVMAAALLAAGYLAGSIPFGLLLTRLAGLGDVRRIGSGNTGATNVLRTGAKGLAALTLALDIAKGGAVVLAGSQLGLGEWAPWAGLAAILGHDFPVWLGFRGGKGVATSMGVLLVVAWPVSLVGLAVWIAAAILFRYSSLAAVLAFIAVPMAAAWAGGAVVTLLAFAIGLLGVGRHQANIRRLLRGEEPKIGDK
jgi:glycerol-3-phosphate acyltransferase PlsY